MQLIAICCTEGSEENFLTKMKSKLLSESSLCFYNQFWLKSVVSQFSILDHYFPLTDSDKLKSILAMYTLLDEIITF